MYLSQNRNILDLNASKEYSQTVSNPYFLLSLHIDIHN